MRRACLALLLAGCGVREPGIEVGLALDVLTPQVTSLQAATVAIERVELRTCPQARWWQALSPLSTAWAHGTEPVSSPRALVTPVLLDLRTAGPVAIGTVRPPPGTYCSLEVTFAPSTADVREQGTTLYLDAEALRQLTAVTRVIPVSLPQPLRLDADQLDGSIVLELQLPEPGRDGADTLDRVTKTLRAR